jgi:polysaccharide chain length determinant protein (PEP-CTERM system associated)
MKAQLLMVMGYLRMTWMYRWLALAVAFLLCVAGWLAVLSLPNQYEVSTRLYIDTKSMLRPLLRGLVVSDNSLQDTVALMRRTLLTRPTLEELSRRTDLDLRATTPAAQDRLIADLASRIGISAQNKRDDTYQLRFVDSDPKLAKKLVDELLSIFLESAIGDTRQDRAVATQFLDQQIAEYERRLIEAEERLKDFKLKNMQLMPDSGVDFYARMGKAQEELKRIQLDIKEAERRREELKRQAAEVPAILEDDEPLFGMGGEQIDPAASPEVQMLDQRIAGMQSKLDEMLLQYTEKHPEIRQIQSLMQAMEEEREAALEKAMAQAAAAPPLPDLSALQFDNPVKQRVAIALSEADAQIAALRSREEDFDAAVNELRGLIDTVPQVEAELTRLNRDYDINKRQYDELVSRREAAKLSTDAEQAADPVKIKVIEPPRMPVTPIGPARLQLLSGVLVLGVVAGFGLAFLISQLSPRVFTRNDLKELTGLPVLGAVTFVRNQWHQSERRMELAVFSLSFFVLVAMYGGLIALHLMNVDLPGYVNRMVGGLL